MLQYLAQRRTHSPGRNDRQLEPLTANTQFAEGCKAGHALVELAPTALKPGQPTSEH
jgi:methylase of polypeptide subunit release factors